MRRITSSLVATALLVGFLSPAAQADDTAPDLTLAQLLDGVEGDLPEVEPSAVVLRLAALEDIFSLDTSGFSDKDHTRYDDALVELSTTGEFFVADRVVDEELFKADDRALQRLSKIDPNPELDAAVSELLHADLRAVEAEYDALLTLMERSGTDSTDVTERYEKKLERFDLNLEQRDWKQAGDRLRQAWRIVESDAASLLDAADADNDLLPTWVETELGTDPDVADSDGDGLSDFSEIVDTFTDPTVAFTDEGVADGAADIDGDGLTAVQEVAAATLTTEADSDGDSLTDGFEVLEFGSSPVEQDTDSDGLDDDSEYRLGTDPNNPDSDGDGTPDGEETYTSHLVTDGYGLAITGVGDVAAAVAVTDESQSPLFEDVPGLMSPAVDFSTDVAFSGAEVSFPVSAESLTGIDPSGAVVGYFDEETGVLTPMVTTFDSTTRTFTAHTEHFTTFVLFYVPTWQAVFKDWVPGSGTGGGTVGLDAAFVLDSSGSMSSNDPAGYRKLAAKSFVDALIDGDRVTVVDFDSSANVYYALGEDFVAAKAAIDRVNASGGTNIGVGVSAGLNQLLASPGRDERAQVLILLTDGQGSYDTNLTSTARDNGIQIYTVGLGTGVNASLLGDIAAQTGGQYFPVAQADDLPNVFSRILDDLGDQDTDGDGLLDRWELGGMPTGSGRVVYTDPTLVDSDGDLIPDGSEIIRSGAPWLPDYFAMISDPSRVDSDFDGLTDAEERDLGLPPLRFDKDGDGLGDGAEYDLGYDPGNANPDGDRFDDSDEFYGDTDPYFYDPSVGDRVRSFAAGLVLGEVGYWMADRGSSFSVKIAFVPTPQLVIPLDGFFDLCDIQYCETVTDFRPVYADQVEYLVGMVVGGFIPVVDIVVALRDTVGSALQGEWGWAAFELAFGALGFFVPLAGDVPGVIKDAVKWAKRAATFVRGQADVLKAFARMGDVADATFLLLLKGIDPSAATVLARKASFMKGDDLRQIIKGGRQSAAQLARALEGASSIRKVTASATKSGDGWFDSANAVRDFKRRGAEAERFVNARTGGSPERLVTNADDVRYVDDLARGSGEVVATEVKTGDGLLTRFVERQIAKDRALLAENQVTKVVWEFFPSSSGLRVGPDDGLIKALRDAGIDYIVWLP